MHLGTENRPVRANGVGAPFAGSGAKPQRDILAAELSGGTALLYQVAFGKRLATIFGATAYAVSAVLAAFMGGLALGAHLGGRWGHRVRRPLAVYGMAELAVAGVCAASPWMFDAVGQAYVWAARGQVGSPGLLGAIRMLLAALVVVVPTIAMGLTLPLLSRVVAGRDEQGGAARRLTLLYAANTAGGAAGALCGGYLVLPVLGVCGAMRAAALVNVAIGLVAVGLGWRAPLAAPEAAAPDAPAGHAGAPPAPGDAGPSRRELGLLGALAGVSGLLVFAAEVVDTHLLALLIGNSAYAFSLMLVAFLSCLGAGATLAGPFAQRLGRAALPAALALAGVAVLAFVPWWDRLPSIFQVAGHRVSSWHARELVRALAALAILVVPTTCMGLTFPLLLRRVAGHDDVASLVGRLTAINTLGSIFGSVGCAYFLLPALGSEWTLRAIGLAFAGAALVVAARQPPEAGAAGPAGAARGPGAKAVATAGALCALGALLLPRWDMVRLTNGANVYFDARPRPEELLFVREDVHGGLTSVERTGPVHTLFTNGKFQGDDGAQIPAQRSFAHFPSLFAAHHGRALVIGLGTGMTLGTLAAYPYEAIDVAEISPAIVDAARRFFSGPNRNALADPRVRLLLEDGRNVLELAPRPYDVITIELTSVWFAGAANLYSLEFYRLCRSRLRPGGVLQQWVQLHHIYRRDLAVILRTLRAVFPHVGLFVSGAQGIVVAGASELRASERRLDELGARPEIRATLAGAEAGPALRELLGRLVLSGPELDRFVSESEDELGPLVSTDENLYLEHATPKGNVMDYHRSLDATIAMLGRYKLPALLERHLGP
ncbi:MAG: spermidine synthase [Deltaproteobacteria bacterium]|nr:spermidine synthase [Deltaproteobacteria bacterium]